MEWFIQFEENGEERHYCRIYVRKKASNIALNPCFTQYWMPFLHLVNLLIILLDENTNCLN